VGAVHAFESVDGGDVRVVHGREKTRFALEASEALSVARELLGQDLKATSRLSFVLVARYTTPHASPASL
jgi:hypothetical protein